MWKKLILSVIVLFIIIGFIEKNQLCGSYALYKLSGELIEALNNGDDNIRMELSVLWKKEKEENSVKAIIDYIKNGHFSADVNFNSNKVLIVSDKSKTEVDIINKNMTLLGSGNALRNFDVLLMANEIIHNHPQLTKMTDISWGDRLALGAWALFNCDMYKVEKDGRGFLSIQFPRELVSANLNLLIDDDTYLVEYNNDKDDINAEITVKESLGKPSEHNYSAEKKIAVKRNELNKGIYRGAIRAAGILIENAMPPTVGGADKKWGKGILTYVDGNRVFIASGTHKEIGEAHGVLLKDEVQRMVDATLYTVGWAYTIERGVWFADEMRNAYKRLEPYIPQKYQDEMEGLSETSGIPLEEIHLTNVFPALFHCSGFAVFNDATVDGKLYHGRVLDYMVGIGLQFHAVVYILHPDGSNAFANVGFAGFIGSVSGMNDQQVAFGEMGGGGVGDWDGMPMAFLMRDGLETTNTLQEAVNLFKTTPRTCEYYYVISDGKIPDARGLATSPSRFEVIHPNQYHKQLPHPVKDAVLMSAGKRYEELAKRIKENFGEIDSEKAIRLMDRPVAMKSNLHDVLFAPQSLEFWVANAGAHTPACNEPYTHYSLKDLLKRLK